MSRKGTLLTHSSHFLYKPLFIPFFSSNSIEYSLLSAITIHVAQFIIDRPSVSHNAFRPCRCFPNVFVDFGWYDLSSTTKIESEICLPCLRIFAGLTFFLAIPNRALLLIGNGDLF